MVACRMSCGHHDVHGQNTVKISVFPISQTCLSPSPDSDPFSRASPCQTFQNSFRSNRKGEIFHLPCGDMCASTCLDQSEDMPSMEVRPCAFFLEGEKEVAESQQTDGVIQRRTSV